MNSDVAEAVVNDALRPAAMSLKQVRTLESRTRPNDFTNTSQPQEIETWVAALGHYDNNEFEEALRIFDDIADTSKILFNCGVIHATLGEHEKAVGLLSCHG